MKIRQKVISAELLEDETCGPPKNVFRRQNFANFTRARIINTGQVYYACAALRFIDFKKGM